MVKLLREDKEIGEVEEGNDSIDTQIDKLLSVYAKNSSIDSPEDDVSDDEAKLDDTTFTPEEFANDISNLIENFQNLVEIKKTVFRRAINHLAKTHDSNVVDATKEKLKELGFSDEDEEDAVSPPAADAGPVGQGAGGGGPV